jgi:peroxiredoxin
VSTTNYESLPEGLPAPVDDGAAAHLPGMTVPSIVLRATTGQTVDLALVGSPRAIVFVYPMTGTPGVPLIEGWDEIPGARGCTPEAIGFRSQYRELARLGADVYGVSTQSAAAQAEAASRLELPFALLSDAGLVLAERLRLPTFEAGGRVMYKRLTLVLNGGRIEHVCYPVFPPDRHAAEVLDWLRRQAVG